MIQNYCVLSAAEGLLQRRGGSCSLVLAVKCLWAAGTYCTRALVVLLANSSGKVTPCDSHLPATNAWSRQGPPCQELGQALWPLLAINPSFTQAGRIWRRNCSVFTLIKSLHLLLPATSEADRDSNKVMTNWLEEVKDVHLWAETGGKAQCPGKCYLCSTGAREHTEPGMLASLAWKEDALVLWTFRKSNATQENNA